MSPPVPFDNLALGHWITAEQHEAGIMFGALCRQHDTPQKLAMHAAIENDLIKIDALDLMHRVCRNDDARVAFDRMNDLRRALDMIVLRLKQIELSAQTPRRAARVLPGGR